MVVTNTFRHTSENPRFRAVLTTSECITRQVYKLIYQDLADKLGETGYSVDRKDKTRRTSSFSNSRPHEILPQFGIPDTALNGKHKPCPSCGGEDRFRFTDRHGDGDYFCSHR
jgi:hypothetical protein